MAEPLTVHNLGSSLESWYKRHAEAKLTKSAGDNFRQLVRNAAHLQERALEYLETIEALALKVEAMERLLRQLKEWDLLHVNAGLVNASYWAADIDKVLAALEERQE